MTPLDAGAGVLIEWGHTIHDGEAMATLGDHDCRPGACIEGAESSSCVQHGSDRPEVKRG
jgi:hypothetical protein